MNLQSEIKPELWEAIFQQYNAENYSNAIISAFHYLRDLIRDSANVDGDGAALIGQAFGGNPPRLRINKFETESQKDEQKGFESILRGLYQGIRNPRTHDKIEDKKETADAVILFINYAIGVIRKANGPFTLDEWLGRVFDPDFVASERYAQLLVSDVPPKRYIESLSALFRRKMEGDGDKLKLVFVALCDLVSEDRLDELLEMISEELKTTQDEAIIRRTLQILPEKVWPRIDEAARLRIENKLIRSIESGNANSSTRRAISGSLGTWARDYSDYFTLRSELYRALLNKIKGSDGEQAYVALYFWSILPHNFTKPVSDYWRITWVLAICDAVLKPFGSSIVREKLADTFIRALS
jgi:uncharacterized protein (TIGR02391 family)